MIYLDNNATTKCCFDVISSMMPFFDDSYGNPSSTYSFGRDVSRKITEARKNIGKLLNASSDEIIFTSCASEANVLAIMSAVRSFPEKRHIITTSVEHASVMETMKYLESIGYNIT